MENNLMIAQSVATAIVLVIFSLSVPVVIITTTALS